MIPLNDLDEEEMFQELHEEILISELDQRRALEYAYRIYKTESNADGELIRFRFWFMQEYPGSFSSNFVRVVMVLSLLKQGSGSSFMCQTA